MAMLPVTWELYLFGTSVIRVGPQIHLLRCMLSTSEAFCGHLSGFAQSSLINVASKQVSRWPLLLELDQHDQVVEYES